MKQRAASEIVRCVEACLRHKRPVYIEVPHDMADREIPIGASLRPFHEKSDPHTLAAALDETLALIRAAKNPVILAGRRAGALSHWRTWSCAWRNA